MLKYYNVYRNNVIQNLKGIKKEVVPDYQSKNYFLTQQLNIVVNLLYFNIITNATRFTLSCLSTRATINNSSWWLNQRKKSATHILMVELSRLYIPCKVVYDRLGEQRPRTFK